MDDLTIRDGKMSDVNTIVRFQKDMAMETENKVLIDDDINKGVMSVFNEDNKGFYLVAQSGREVVGSLLVTYEWSDWRNSWFWWIQSVYVAKTWRRKGIYRYLNDEVIKRCRATNDVCGIRLYVEKNNMVAQNVYQNLGMKETDYLLYEFDL